MRRQDRRAAAPNRNPTLRNPLTPSPMIPRMPTTKSSSTRRVRDQSRRRNPDATAVVTVDAVAVPIAGTRNARSPALCRKPTTDKAAAPSHRCRAPRRFGYCLANDAPQPAPTPVHRPRPPTLPRRPGSRSMRAATIETAGAQSTTADAPLTTGIALAASAATGTPVAPKATAQLKTAAIAKRTAREQVGANGTTGIPGHHAGDAAERRSGRHAAAAAAKQTADNGRRRHREGGRIRQYNADVATNAPPTACGHRRCRQTLVNSSDNGVPGAGDPTATADGYRNARRRRQLTVTRRPATRCP